MKLTKFFLFSLVIFFSVLIKLSAVSLRPHQQFVVDYLQRESSQKGLLVSHALGSGKTYLALGYSELHPKKKVILLLPRFLKSNWKIQMTSYGVKDQSRYEMVSLREAPKLLHDRSFKNTIVIIDEVHKLIDLVTNQTNARSFQDLYVRLRSASKVIALTGTPIYNHPSDLAYLANLVSGQQLFDTNRNIFKQKYLKINPLTSLIRGHFLESKLMYSILPVYASIGSIFIFGVQGTTPILIPIMGMAGSVVPSLLRDFYPTPFVSFRSFDVDKMANFSNRYLSFFEIDESVSDDYPTQSLEVRDVHYSDPQVNLFLNFVDKDLSVPQLKIFYSDDLIKRTDVQLGLESAMLQDQLHLKTGPGREIGNLRLQDDRKNWVESPKFVEIYKVILSNPGQVAIYSNYEKHGVEAFASYLKQTKDANSFVYLHPEESVDQQISKIKAYNTGKKRIMLIHPEITEGISLVATEQFHILEPIANAALLEQVIGRAVRLNSHKALPKERRHVNVYLWKSVVDYELVNLMLFHIPSSAGLLRRKHWQRKYSEVNPSTWTGGILGIDQQYYQKEKTPDEIVFDATEILKRDMMAYRELARQHSIERVKR